MQQRPHYLLQQGTNLALYVSCLTRLSVLIHALGALHCPANSWTRNSTVSFIKECLHAQDAKPRVAFALASAISAAVEGSADAAQLVADSGGIAVLVRIMRHGSGHGKKAAAEALQVLRQCPLLKCYCGTHGV